MQHKIMRRSNVIPAVLLIYLGIMAYIGRGEFQAGHYLYYFGIIGATLACIIALRFFLRRRERLRAEREDDIRRKGR
ncbi:MAG: hypothetical protein K2O27_05340 [Candidatus Amulumruptor sp.]|nr:hypothetical protein [Candidatus Amulumruptor sp.]MDE7237088.1 hypothetical protein [Paramuribaculum sp.]